MADLTLRPIARSDFGYLEAQHLLNRAAFGAPPQMIARYMALGPDDAIEQLVEYDQAEGPAEAEPEVDRDIFRPLTQQQRVAIARARQNGDEKVLAQFRADRNQRQRMDRRQLANLQDWWLERMATTARPLQEKLTLCWHGHFATNYRGCEDSFLLYQQNKLFRENATDFARLATGIVRDPAMIVFLNNDRNYNTNPNENLAREFMELFTLGEGNYTERDIKHGARALTGYTRSDNDFLFNQHVHDQGVKSILGKRGTFDGDDFVKLCLARSDCSRFVCGKLYQWFVADQPDGLTREALVVVENLGRKLRESDYDLKPVLKMLFRSRHFYDASVRGAMIKSPVQLVVGLRRVLATPSRDARSVRAAMQLMGQALFNPPNVAGWPGGRSWINTATLFVRQNLAAYLITGKTTDGRAWTEDDLAYDAMKLIEQLDQPDAATVVEHLSQALLGAAATEARKKQLLEFAARYDNRLDNRILVAMLCLITAMPEFQLC